MEEILYKNIKFVMWDIGGQEAVRASWNTYYVNTHVRSRTSFPSLPYSYLQAVILVVDSTDRGHLATVKEELAKMLCHEVGIFPLCLSFFIYYCSGA